MIVTSVQISPTSPWTQGKGPSKEIIMFQHVFRTCMILAMGAACLVSSVPRAQADNPRRFTWPGVATTVATINGWIVVEGRSMDQYNNLLWQTPLARTGGSVSMRHGWGSVFVEVGGRQFVIDESNGNAREIRAGHVVRQDLPWTPPAPPPRSYTDNTSDATGTSSVPLSEDAKAMLERMNKVNQDLIEALANLEIVAKQFERNQATYADVAAARARVRTARANLDLAERGLLKNMPADLAQLPPPQPEVAPLPSRPPPQDPKVTVAQKKLLDLTAQHVVAQTEVLRLREAVPVNDAALAAAQKRVDDLAEQVDQVDSALHKLRLVEDIEPCPFKLSPMEMARIAQVERNILELNQKYRQADDRMQKAQAAYANKTGSLDDVQATQNEVVSLMKKINVARRDLDDLRRTTCQAVQDAQEKDSTTRPAG